MSGLARLEKLMFSVFLIDRVSQPAGKMQKNLRAMQKQTKEGLTSIGIGTAGLIATGMGIHAALEPGLEMLRSIGEVKSLGVQGEALKKLEEASYGFTGKFGGSAAEFVKSAYDIQSAINGLAGDELATFTTAGATLAKATRGNTGEITSYMGTMYGIFQSTADKMGKSNWVQVLAGQTALAVQTFKTDGPKMAGAFESLGAGAANARISMQEQFSVLGMLQSTMSGEKSGTAYKAFLRDAVGAQAKLGLKFSDSKNQMLPMVDILNMISEKYGDVSNMKTKGILQGAFGDESINVVNLLIGKTGELQKNIQKIGAAKGMDDAAKMAKEMTDPWDAMMTSIGNVRTLFSKQMVEVFRPFMGAIQESANKLAAWEQRFPHITHTVAKVVSWIFILIGVISLLAIIVGTGKIIGAVFGFINVLGILKNVISGLSFVFSRFGLMLLMNPFTLYILGALLLIAAAALLYIYWNNLKSAFMDSSWGQATIGVFETLSLWLTDFMEHAVNACTSWQGFLDLMSNLNPITAMINQIGWLIEKLKLIPGISIGDGGAQQTQVPSFLSGAGFAPMPQANGAAPQPIGPVAAVQSEIPAGGVMNRIANSVHNKNGGTSIGVFNVNTSQPMTAGEMDHFIGMAGA